MPVEYMDQLHRTVVLSGQPKRIVSLVPSQTEFLFDIGAGDQVAGVTRFCVHPAHARKEKVIVGGTKNYDLARIRALNPDLIIGNKEENVKQSIEELARDFPVWMSDISSLGEALEMMHELGQITGNTEKADDIVNTIKDQFNHLPKLQAKKTLYLIWKNPYMAAGNNTFIHDMINRIGLENAISHMGRYPSLSALEIRDLDPGLILLSSEPYPFRQQDAEEIGQLCPGARVIHVDGELFSWYGSRLIHAPAGIARLFMDQYNPARSRSSQ